MRQQRLFVIATAIFLSMLAFICASIVQLPLPALAHSFVIGSDPVDGSTIQAMPSTIRIFFNAPISSISNARIYYIQGGTLIDVGAGHSNINPSSPRELDTPIKTPNTQPQGSYEVKWTAVSNDDGHTTYGLIGFNLGFSGTGLSGTPMLGPSTSNKLDGEGGVRTLDLLGILAVGWDWLILLALTLWAGVLTVQRLLLPTNGRTLAILDRTKKRTASLQTMCLYVLFLGEIVAVLLRTNRLTRGLEIGNLDINVLLQILTQTNYGWLWLTRMALIIVALALLSWDIRSERPAPLHDASRQLATPAESPQARITIDLRASSTATKEQILLEEMSPAPAPRHTALWLLLAGALLLTYAISDGKIQTAQPHFSAIIFSWLSLATQGVWFGGVAYLGTTLLPLGANSALDHHAESLAVLLRRLTPLLLTCMGIALVSSFFLSETSISDIQLLLTDTYGRTLLLQIILFALLLLLSLYTWLWLCPRLTRQAFLLPVVDADRPARRTRQSAIGHTEKRLKGLANIHSWLAAGVLLCSALMVFFAPPIVFPDITYSNPPISSTSNMQTKQLGDLSVTLQVLPGHTNSANTVVLTITDNNGTAVTNAQVQLITNMLVMDMGTAETTIKGGNPLYIATFARNKTFSMAGLWAINVHIQRPDQAPVEGAFQVMLS